MKNTLLDIWFLLTEDFLPLIALAAGFAYVGWIINFIVIAYNTIPQH